MYILKVFLFRLAIFSGTFIFHRSFSIRFSRFIFISRGDLRSRRLSSPFVLSPAAARRTPLSVLRFLSAHFDGLCAPLATVRKFVLCSGRAFHSICALPSVCQRHNIDCNFSFRSMPYFIWIVELLHSTRLGASSDTEYGGTLAAMGLA